MKRNQKLSKGIIIKTLDVYDLFPFVPFSSYIFVKFRPHSALGKPYAI